MSRIRYILAAMVGASLTASCGVTFRAADQHKTPTGKTAVATEEGAMPAPRAARGPY
ncbi:MAG TPA: hypothetical protein VM891_00440 [Amaricoccus sp.]|jgi:hypothetical protein|nr:hypothetical protein [Amaricoccus sp.]